MKLQETYTLDDSFLGLILFNSLFFGNSPLLLYNFCTFYFLFWLDHIVTAISFAARVFDESLLFEYGNATFNTTQRDICSINNPF